MNLQLMKFIKKSYSTPGKALDLGCGDGEDMRELEKVGWNCDGVDLETGTDLNLPYLSPNRPYDLVYSNFVIHKLTKPESLAVTIANNLNDSGKFLVQTFHETDQYARRAFAEKALADILEAAGLKVENVSTFTVDEGAPDFHHHTVLQAIGKKN